MKGERKAEAEKLRECSNRKKKMFTSEIYPDFETPEKKLRKDICTISEKREKFI